jgi:hypothetical protein
MSADYNALPIVEAVPIPIIEAVVCTSVPKQTSSPPPKTAKFSHEVTQRMDLIIWVQNLCRDFEEITHILTLLCQCLDSEHATTPKSVSAIERMVLENMRSTLKRIERSRTSNPDFVSNVELRETLAAVHATVAAANELVEARRSKLTDFAQPSLPFFTLAATQITMYALKRLKQRIEKCTTSELLMKNGDVALKVLSFALVRGTAATVT